MQLENETSSTQERLDWRAVFQEPRGAEPLQWEVQPADMLTKPLSSGKIRSLGGLIGLIDETQLLPDRDLDVMEYKM